MEIIDSLHEMVVVTDTAYKIITINVALENELKRKEPPLYLHELIVEHELLQRMIVSSSDEYVTDITLNLKGETGTVMVNGAVTVFKDRFDDTVGYIITAHKIEERVMLLKQSGITEREYDLIKLIIAGNSNKEIGRVLGITVRTVETHITNIFNKLGLNKRSEIVNYCSDLFMGR
jgi:DNA-binding CsgD family transcriptional regulator